MATIDEQGPSKLATIAPLALAALGPIGAAAGVGGMLFQAGRRRNAQADFAAEVRETDFDPATGSSADILGEMLERENAGLGSSQALTQALAAAQGREQAAALAARDAQIAAAAAARQQALDERAIAERRFNQTNVLRDDITPIMQPVITGGRQMNSMVNAPAGFAGDQILINSFARMLNPGERLTQDDIEAVSGDPRLSAQLQSIIRRHFETGEDLSAGERGLLVEAAAGVLKFTQDAARLQLEPILAVANNYDIPPESLVAPGAFVPDVVLTGVQRQGRQAGGSSGSGSGSGNGASGSAAAQPARTSTLPFTLDEQGRRVYDFRDIMREAERDRNG